MQIDKAEIVIGTRVHCTLYGGRDGIVFAIRGRQTPSNCNSFGGVIATGGSASFDIVWENGTQSAAVPESLVRCSVQWRILPGIAPLEEVQALCGLAVLEENRRADEQAEKTRKMAEAIAALRADSQYAHLKQTTPNGYGSAALAAGNIRAELKKAFPGIKFSVRSKTFSGGDSIDVSWIDGPLTSQVENIARKYSAGSFNGMEDIYEYSKSAWTAVFGDAKYVHCARSHGAEALKEAVREVCMQYGWDLMKVESHLDGSAYLPSDNHDRYRLIYDFIEKRHQYSN
jgi:hypothetical protein